MVTGLALSYGGLSPAARIQIYFCEKIEVFTWKQIDTLTDARRAETRGRRHNGAVGFIGSGLI